MAKESDMRRYPLRLRSRPVERVWGGSRLGELFGRALPASPVGESWEVFGDLPVVEGPLAGSTLDELSQRYGPEFLGTAPEPEGGFPLLTKWLDCREWLSIQVHPDDLLARRLTGLATARGKTECWYFLDVDEGAEVIHGLNEGVPPELAAGLTGDELVACLRRVRPRPGEFMHTPAGTVHALGPGLVLYEIQQSCDLTYRFYDWGRPRELHRTEAATALREAVLPPELSPPADAVGEVSVHCPFFVVEVVEQPCRWKVGATSFEILTVVAGEARVGDLLVKAGDSVVLPACLGPVELVPEPRSRCLRIRVPSGRTS